MTKNNKATGFEKSRAAKRFASHTKRKQSEKPHFGAKRTSSFRPKGKTALIEGVFSATERGFGFVMPDASFNLDADIFIPADSCGGALAGDRVIARVNVSDLVPREGNKFRAEGEIVEIRERGIKEFCGTLILDSRYIGRSFSPYRVIPDNPRLCIEAEIDDIGEYKVGNKVQVCLIDYGKGKRPPKGRIIKDLGEPLSLGANYESVLLASGIRTEFPDEVSANAEKVASEPITAAGREDLRDMPIFTIDGADAKDLDDAISLTVTKNGYTLGVHIADVSHYVEYGTPVDKEAFARGTSVYFTDKVVPMLPRCLSNGVCSLNAGTDKYALSAFVELDKCGEIIGCRVVNSIINSKVRGVYSEVNDILAKKSHSEFYEKYKPVCKEITAMYPLYKILENRAKIRGVLELESAEARFVLDENGMPVDVIKRERGEAEKMIEQFMLAANEAVARYMCDKHIPCVFRVHEVPSEEKLTVYRNFVHNMGISTISLHQKNLTTAAFAPIIKEATDKGVESVISRVTLRTQMKAKYSSTRGDHFGLGLEYYCHFTSPIRRYPDLSVHRILKFALSNGAEAATARYARFAAESADCSSQNEIKAMTAERDIEDLYKVIFMEKEVGHEYDATISSVTSFGLFCELDNTCEGLIPTELLGEGFKFNEEALTLSRGKTSYKLGQPLRVRITEVSVLRRRIYMEIVR